MVGNYLSLPSPARAHSRAGRFSSADLLKGHRHTGSANNRVDISHDHPFCDLTNSRPIRTDCHSVWNFSMSTPNRVAYSGQSVHRTARFSSGLHVHVHKHVDRIRMVIHQRHLPSLCEPISQPNSKKIESLANHPCLHLHYPANNRMDRFPL